MVSSFLVTINRRRGFYASFATGSSPPNLVLELCKALPLSEISPVEMDIWFGPEEDTNEEQVELYLIYTDQGNLPEMASVRENSIWSARQKWQNQGTPANTLQVVEHDHHNWIIPPIFSNTQTSERATRWGLSIVEFGSSGLDMIIQGNFTWVERIMQRSWPDDNAFDHLDTATELLVLSD